MIDAGPGYNYQSVGVTGRADQMEVCYIVNWADENVTVQQPLSPAIPLHPRTPASSSPSMKEEQAKRCTG